MKTTFFTLLLVATVYCLFSFRSTNERRPSSYVDPHENSCPVRDFEDPFASVGSFEELKAVVSNEFSQMGLRTEWPVRGNSYDPFTEADFQDAKRVAKVAYYVMRIYPREVFTNGHLEKIRFAKNITVKGTVRTARPNYFDRTLDYGITDKDWCDSFMQLQYHHEFFHLMERRIYGTQLGRDSHWRELNADPNFRYGNGGITAYQTTFDNSAHPAPGFVSNYSTLAEEEDRAEIYGYLMTPGYHDRLQAWAQDDPALMKKVQYLIQKIQSKISPDLIRVE